MEQEEEEVVEVKVAKKPERPSEEEVERHRSAGHPNFRSWCDHCVRGRAESGHHRQGVTKPEKATFCSDYMTMKSTEGRKREWEKGEKGGVDEGLPIIVWKERKSGVINAHVVPEKGANHYAAKRIAQDIKWLGYGELVWKSDQEAAIVALRDLVQEYVGQAVRIIGEGGCEGESRDRNRGVTGCRISKQR